MNTFKPLPVGTADYKKIITEGYYLIDKTQFIKEIIDDKPEVFLVARPRRFGKTLNMSMLKYFFDITEDNGEELFQQSKIWGAGKKYQDEHKKYPVIFLTFKDIKNDNWEDTFDNLKEIIILEYYRHYKYLLSDQSDLLDGEKERYLNLCNGQATAIQYQNSLAWLTHLLKRNYKQPVILLIDEYDIPIQQGHICGFYNKIITFMRNFLSGGLKDNSNLKFAFLTGILRVAKESIFSGLNNLEVYTCIDEKYSSYFGFTEAEVTQIANDYHCDKLSEIKNWYNGYKFGEFSNIYNPWSVLRYMKSGFKPDAYWLSTSDNKIISDLIMNATHEIEQILTDILNGGIFYSDINTDIIYPSINDNPKNIFSFLTMTGYLKAESHFINDKTFDYALSIPNKEIEIVYQNHIIEKISLNHNNDSTFDNFSKTFTRAVLSNDSDTMDKALRSIAEYTMSYYDSHENFYHGWMLSMTALFLDSHRSYSNRESGEGRFDLLLEPITADNGYPGVIFEFKVLDKNTKKDITQALDAKAKEAYDQINLNKYDRELKERGVSKIIKYGIAFYKKQLSIYSGKE